MNTNKQTKQVFRFAAPAAKSVLLVGEFTDWHQHGIPMQKDSNGTWTANVALSPGTHRYRFIVDGQWRDDPECKSRVPNPFGTEDMLREAA
jgi:1,4-alpha-glucan branching enzyme